MKPKERVLRAIRRQETDRPPLDIDVAGDVAERLQSDLGLASWEEVRRFLQVDMRGVGIGAYTGPQRLTPDGEPADFWGGTGGGTYADSIGYRPLQNADSVDDIYDYTWPDPADFDYSNVERDCDEFADYATRGSSWAPIFCLACSLCGMETMLCNMVAMPEVAKAVLDRVTDVYLEMNQRMFEAARGKLDICYMGDDFGSQQGLLMSPETFRAMIKPNLRRLYAHAKECGLITMHHSCGSVVDVIPDLIEIGVDVLDPVQVRANGMDPATLKRRFGNKLAFHGAIDTQHTLPFGTAEEVRAQVREMIAILGDGGGYIVCGSQTLISDIPTPNILAMCDEAIKHR